MLQEVWQKSIPLTFQLCEDDLACEIPPLPLVIEAPLNHYLGFCFETVQEFFFRYALQPNSREEFWLEYTEEGKSIELSPTDLIVNLYMRYFRQQREESPVITVHYRKDEGRPIVELVDFYRQSLKASTAIKYRKQGAGVLFSLFSNDQLNGLAESLKRRDYEQFYGRNPSPNEEEMGFRLLARQYDNVPVRLYTKSERLQRAVDPNSTLGDFKHSLHVGPNLQLCLWTIPMEDSVIVRQLLDFCHADGFLYLYLEA